MLDMKDDKMSPEAFDKFLSKIGLSIDDLAALMLLYKLDAKEMFVVSRADFVNGFGKLGYVSPCLRLTPFTYLTLSDAPISLTLSDSYLSSRVH